MPVLHLPCFCGIYVGSMVSNARTRVGTTTCLLFPPPPGRSINAAHLQALFSPSSAGSSPSPPGVFLFKTSVPVSGLFGGLEPGVSPAGLQRGLAPFQCSSLLSRGPPQGRLLGLRRPPFWIRLISHLLQQNPGPLRRGSAQGRGHPRVPLL